MAILTLEIMKDNWDFNLFSTNLQSKIACFMCRATIFSSDMINDLEQVYFLPHLAYIASDKSNISLPFENLLQRLLTLPISF